MKQIFRHPVVAVACNLLLVMVIYTLSRLLFVAINHDLYPELQSSQLLELCQGGCRFDLTAILYLSSLYCLLALFPLPATWRNNEHYQRVVKGCFLVPNIVGILLNSVDTVYVRFTDRRTTCTFFTEFQNEGNLFSIFCQAVGDYWYLLLATLALIAALVFLYRRFTVNTQLFKLSTTLNSKLSTLNYYIRESALFLTCVYFIVMGIRGGFGAYTRPIAISNAAQYTSSPRQTAIVLNTPFTLIRTIDSETYVNPHYFSSEELASLMSPIHTPTPLPPCPPTPNIVILILESFSQEYLEQGYAPFLDSLLQHSITYTHSFASGRKSIDAMPSILSSIPMLIEPYIVTPYATNAVSSLADCLGQKGYTTAFFHGAPNGSMGFQAYARSAGFDAYYGMDEYNGPEAFDGTWAIWDEEFLQFYATTMTTLQEPFLTSVFTASSHHPYKVPKRYEGVFPLGTIPMHQCIGYSDYALRRFFETAKQQPWYNHTLFVITADHTNQLTQSASNTAYGIYRIPIAFYSPQLSNITHQTYTGPISQTDIMPSVLAYLGYDEPYFAFGEDALTQPKTHPYAVCYNYPYYQILSDSLLVQWDGQEVVGVYNYEQDPLLKHNLQNEPNEKVMTMVTYLKAYIQQYIERMIGNKLRVSLLPYSSTPLPPE